MDIFQKFEIPVKNLLAVLMNLCSVMRGCKTGLDKRLCDGPVPYHRCHHIYNIVKKFLNNFDNYIEKFFPDLYRDFDLSADLFKQLELLCYHIGVIFCKPPSYAAT